MTFHIIQRLLNIIAFKQRTCGPICQHPNWREGLRINSENLAPIHLIRSEFSERNLCELFVR